MQYALNYSGTRFLSTENRNYSMSWWIPSYHLKKAYDSTSFIVYRRQKYQFFDRRELPIRSRLYEESVHRKEGHLSRRVNVSELIARVNSACACFDCLKRRSDML